MKRVKEHIDAIIFDMDGTIIDTDHVWNAAMNDLFKKHNLDRKNACPVRFQTFEKMLGMGLNESIEYLRDMFEIANTSTKEMKAHVVTTAKGLFKEEIKFIKGFEQFHNKLKAAGIASSIATNCDIHSLQELVEKMQFGAFFNEHIYCVDHVENKAKPDPALFLHAADKLGANPEKCMVFEDSIWGFKAANAANMKCIAIKNSRNHDHHPEITHGAIESYDDAENELLIVLDKHYKASK